MIRRRCRLIIRCIQPIRKTHVPTQSPSNRKKHHALLWRINQRFQTVTMPLRIGTLDFSFSLIAVPDRVLDEVAPAVDLQQRLTGKRESQVQHLPYWAEVWDSAAGLG